MPNSCKVCGSSGTLEQPLQHCAKCKSAFYCSRECQKHDWKLHKRTCTPHPTAGQNHTEMEEAGSDREELPTSRGGQNEYAIRDPFGRLSARTWLEDRSKKAVFKLLVDAYRLRVEDEYSFNGDVDEDSLYGQGNPMTGFRKFLRKAETFEAPATRAVLPSWWSVTRRAQCERWARESIGSGEWSDLRCAVEKYDIIEHYGNDSMFPVQLRVLAEAIEGSPVSSFGASGDQISAILSGTSSR